MVRISVRFRAMAKVRVRVSVKGRIRAKVRSRVKLLLGLGSDKVELQCTMNLVSSLLHHCSSTLSDPNPNNNLTLDLTLALILPLTRLNFIFCLPQF